MAVTVARSAMSVLGSSTTSAGPPAFRMAKILSRPPPARVTRIPVCCVYSAASAVAPGAAEAGVSTVMVAALAGAASQASISSATPDGLRLNGLGIHMQDLNQIFEVALDGIFHGAAVRDH